MSVVYFDIETVSGQKSYEELSPAMKVLRDKKASYRKTNDNNSSKLYKEKAAIFAEFGKVVCISYGVYDGNGDFQIQSFAGGDEKKVLSDFFSFLNNYSSVVLCGHNIKEFDIPYLARRALILGIILPDVFLQLKGKKPREITHIDTLELWKFGDYKNYTSLALLCEIFDIPTSKDDIDGSQVTTVFWDDNNIDRIVTYCEKDVLATAQLYKKIK